MANILELRLLGGFELYQNKVRITEIRTRKTLALLSYLVLTARSQSRSTLDGLLWGGMPEARARGNLSKALSILRPIVGAQLATTPQTVAFEPDDGFWLDVTAFEAAATGHSIDGLVEATRLYRGDFLAGFSVRDAPEFEDWVLAQQARLKALVLEALHTLAAHFAEAGKSGRAKAMAYLTRLLQLEPWREEAHRQLMSLLAQEGHRAAALAQYETCRQVLAEELAVEPSAATLDLVDQIGTVQTVEQF